MRTFRLECHREIRDDDVRLGECHVVDERDVRQVDTRLGRCPTVPADRDVAHGLERFVGDRVLLTSDRIEFRVAGEACLERAVEVGAPDALEFVVQLDRDAAGFNDRRRACRRPM